MTAFADAARAAADAQDAADAAARQQAAQALRAAARDAVKAVLVGADGIPFTLADLGLSGTPVADGVFVWADGAGLGLAAVQDEGSWRVFAVRGEGERWTRLGVVGSLADVGRLMR